MSFNEIKLYIINGGTLSITYMTALQDWLKIILLIVTIGYTITKWGGLNNKKDEE